MQINFLDALTSLPEGSHASPTPLQERDMETWMIVRSGERWSGLLANAGLAGSLVKTLLGSSRWGSTLCGLRWKAKATKSGQLYFQLALSTRSTGETDSGLSLTKSLMLPTVTVYGNYNRKGSSPTSSDGLITALKRLLPTPRERDRTSWTKDRGKGNFGEVIHGMMGSSGRLNPRFVEQMMGYPVGYTEIEQSE